MQSDDSSDDEIIHQKRARPSLRNEGTYAPRTKIVLLVVEACVCMKNRIWKTEEILKGPRMFTAFDSHTQSHTQFSVRSK